MADAAKKPTIAQELKAFIFRGNVIDLAVGVAVGTAFTAIVNSVVTDLITPLIGLILPVDDYSSLNTTIFGQLFTFGNLIAAIINFLAVATVLFFVIKGVNRLTRKQAESPTPPAAPTTDQKLLMEIRDLLAARTNGSITAPPVVAPAETAKQ
jgi:large conductance mechanosensitive channel